MSSPIAPKFGTPPPESDGPPFVARPYAYPNVYELQQTSGPQRLRLAPASDHIGLLRDLTSILPGPFSILYVLTLSRRDEAKPGRYQSPQPVETVILHSFLEEYRAFLEGDGRH